MDYARVAVILDEAADLIDGPGKFWQGGRDTPSPGEGGTGTCAGLAICLENGRGYEMREGAEDAKTFFADFLGPVDFKGVVDPDFNKIVTWNDQEGRTQVGVVAMLRAAAQSARDKDAQGLSTVEEEEEVHVF